MPAEAEGVELECKAWLPGCFSAADQFGVHTYGEVRARIFSHLGETHAKRTRLVKGFFADSLTPTLKKERGLQPAAIIDVDVDLYISTVQCMEWMVEQGLCVPGCRGPPRTHVHA